MTLSGSANSRVKSDSPGRSGGKMEASKQLEQTFLLWSGQWTEKENGGGGGGGGGVWGTPKKLELNNDRIVFAVLNAPIRASFRLFESFSTVTSKYCRWLDSNCGPLVFKETCLPPEPQPLPSIMMTLVLSKIFTLRMLKICKLLSEVRAHEHWWPQ